ncbi:hypothetical protein BBJ28_00014280 [Nothophytophthora sp. Chile5]|nr:hypothetical protein BBJ28_00014280 [Nothophytophthora sp. Chile5]
MSLASLPASARSALKLHISNIEESGFVYSGQSDLGTIDKSAYADFSMTPYTAPVPIALNGHSSGQATRESSLHETNRSQNWEISDGHKMFPFVTHKPHLRECLAEFLGAIIVIGFGLGVNSQVGISDGEAGNTMTVSLGWGVAVLMGVYTAENVSGAQIISVITFTHAVYGRMPWWKVPGYVCAQTLGAFVATALVYLLHHEQIELADPNKETLHHLFITYPNNVTNYTAFYSEALACAFLMGCAYAITDQRNRCPGPVGTPFALALMIMALVSAFSMNTGLGVSLNRDFGARLFTYIAGYHSVFTEFSYYFWIPIVAPCVGGVIGAGAYILFVEIQHPQTTT